MKEKINIQIKMKISTQQFTDWAKKWKPISFASNFVKLFSKFLNCWKK